MNVRLALMLSTAVLGVSLSPATSTAGVISQSGSAPVGSVVAHETNQGAAVIFRASDTTASNRIIAQSFTMPETASIEAITVKSNTSSATNVYPSTGTHVVQLAIMQDTNANNIGDTQVGGISTFDVAGLTFANNSYLTFTLDAPVNLLSGQKYSFEFFFTTADPDNSLGLWRSNANDAYAGGSFAAANNKVGSPFPGGDTHLSTDTTRDVTFYVQPIPEPTTLMVSAVVAGLAGLGARRRVVTRA